jgi:nucleotide-binding universal stress UspA family protein
MASEENVMLSIHTILHPTDFSDCSRYAFRLAGMLASEQGARLVILHVKPTLGPLAAHGKALAELQPEGSQEKLLEILHQFRVSDPKVQVEHRLVNGGGPRNPAAGVGDRSRPHRDGNARKDGT